MTEPEDRSNNPAVRADEHAAIWRIPPSYVVYALTSVACVAIAAAVSFYSGLSILITAPVGGAVAGLISGPIARRLKK